MLNSWNRPPQEKRLSYLARRSYSGEGIDFVRCRICGDHRRVISGRHLSKHGADRETYMEEYSLSPDEPIVKGFRIIQRSRRGYRPYGKRGWIQAIKKIYAQGRRVFAGDLQDKHPYLYDQGIWIFGDWDKTLRAAGFDPERMRLRSFWDREMVVKEIRRLRSRNVPLFARHVITWVLGLVAIIRFPLLFSSDAFRGREAETTRSRTTLLTA